MAVNLRILIENEFSTDGRGLPYKNDGGGGGVLVENFRNNLVS